METMEPPESTSGGADVGGPDRPEPEPEVAAPPVVAVVVTTGSGAGLEGTLGSLAGQDYPALSVLVLDDASDDDPTARIAATLPTAYVRRLTARVGFAAAANEALSAVEGATFLVFCHDDVAFDPDAVRVMVEEAYRSNAAIVGPKLVDWDHPEVLLEVGMAVDHYAVPFSPIEPGEIDQEQHDGVRDVFFVSHAALLVRADLFVELGGFDIQTAPGSDDIDLCWRARLAGARVLVAPTSRVRHQHGFGDEERLTRRQPPRDARAATRARVRVLVKSYSAIALLWVLPSGFVLTLGEAFGLAITRRWRHAVADHRVGPAARRARRPSAGPVVDPADADRRRRRHPRPDDPRERTVPQPVGAATPCRRPSRRRLQPGPSADGQDSGTGTARTGDACGVRRCPPGRRIAGPGAATRPRYRRIAGVARCRIVVVDVHVAVALHHGRRT
ncbi:MAG TPA: glycosyltransferase [Acidimicrobiia bacterium]|nr:glycosyltransferase [Acidimicrobiia bacterium]